MMLIDANVVLRYLLDDHQELSARAAAVIESRNAVMPMEVACEVVYVLEKVYKTERRLIQRHLSELVSSRLLAVDKDKDAVLLKALELYGATAFDFVDTLLWSYHVVEQQDVLTFDEKLRKRIERHDSLPQ